MTRRETSTEYCTCQCGLPSCASRSGRYGRKAGLTVHGTVAGRRNGCHCEACVTAHNRTVDARFVRRNQASRVVASKHGQQWTGPELEIATRSDLTVRDAALRLGRTLKAVKNMRHLCKTDPRYIDLLGASRKATA